jgi:membrane protein YdbS with pleckstrin-like domain
MLVALALLLAASRFYVHSATSWLLVAGALALHVLNFLWIGVAFSMYRPRHRRCSPEEQSLLGPTLVVVLVVNGLPYLVGFLGVLVSVALNGKT